MAKVCTDLNGVCMKEQEIQDKALKAYPYDIRGQYSYDANDGKRQGYVTGYKEAPQQVMKDSVDARVANVIIQAEADELQYSVVYPIGERPYNSGDEVRLLIIKEG